MESLRAFDDTRASSYDQRIRRLAPGYETLHEQIVCLLASFLDSEAHLLVVGAGTGAEIAHLGEAQRGWRFTAVDPSADMLDQCRSNPDVASLGPRVDYVNGRVEDLSGTYLFDAATSVFVAHFMPDMAARSAFFQAIADRLRPGAPFVLADLYRSGSDDEMERLMEAWRAYYHRAGASAREAEQAFVRIRRDIHFAPETEIEETLAGVGFTALIRFHQCFLWGGWYTQRKEASVKVAG